MRTAYTYGLLAIAAVAMSQSNAPALSWQYSTAGRSYSLVRGDIDCKPVAGGLLSWGPVAGVRDDNVPVAGFSLQYSYDIASGSFSSFYVAATVSAIAVQNDRSDVVFGVGFGIRF